MNRAWEWLVHSDAGLMARIALGGSFFLILAMVDLWRRGHQATRWREYLFLLTAVAAAMSYGAINDRITSDISWEYFYYGKGLEDRLGSRTPPEPGALHREACKLGLKATWTAGLIAGVVLLIANNPRRHRPRLPYRTLLALLPLIFLIAAACGLAGGIAGMQGRLNWISADFIALAREDVFRPARFLAVFGIHLGGYVGGLVGTIVAAVWVLRRRRARGVKATDNT